MSTTLYEIHEDLTTDPVSYYPEIVPRAELSLEDVCTLMSTSEPLLSYETCRIVINTLSQAIAGALAAGSWVLLEDFCMWQPEFTDVLANPDDTLDTDTLDVVAYQQDAFVDAVEARVTFELLRYAFPVAPYITLAYEAKYNLPDHVEDIVGLFVIGQDFAVDRDDAETGVWLKSPAGNDYKQERVSLIGSTQLLITATLSGEGGAAGQNSVEHELSVRSRYAEGGDIQTGVYASKLRAVNVVDDSNNKTFLIDSQTASIALVEGSTVGQGEMVPISAYVSGSDLQIVTITDGVTSEPVTVSTDKVVTLAVKGDHKFILLNIADFAQLYANVTDRGGLTEVAQLDNTNIPVYVMTGDQFGEVSDPRSCFCRYIPAGTSSISITVSIIVPPGWIFSGGYYSVKIGSFPNEDDNDDRQWSTSGYTYNYTDPPEGFLYLDVPGSFYASVTISYS